MTPVGRDHWRRVAQYVPHDGGRPYPCQVQRTGKPLHVARKSSGRLALTYLKVIIGLCGRKEGDLVVIHGIV